MNAESISHELNSEYGEGSILDLSPSAFKRRQYTGVSSGSLMLNLVLTGTTDIGYVFGKTYEIFGQDGSGKTTLALHFIAELQKKGLVAAFIDMEHALDPLYGASVGVKFEGRNRVLFSQPDSGEEAFKFIYSMIDKGVKGIVLDSVAALVTEAEEAGEPGDRHIAQVARLMSQELKKVVKKANKAGTVLIFLNQIRQKVGVMVGPSDITAGGNALKFYASGARLEIRANRMDKITSSDKMSESKNAIKREESGVKFTIKTVKNKLYPPWQHVKLAIEYGKGIDRKVDIAKFGLHCGIVSEVTDKQFKMGGKNHNFSNTSTDVFKRIYAEAKRAFKEMKK